MVHSSAPRGQADMRESARPPPVNRHRMVADGSERRAGCQYWHPAREKRTCPATQSGRTSYGFTLTLLSPRVWRPLASSASKMSFVVAVVRSPFATMSLL